MCGALARTSPSMPSFCERERNSGPPRWASRRPWEEPSSDARESPASPSSSPATSSPSPARRSRPAASTARTPTPCAAQVERAGGEVVARVTVPDDAEGTRADRRAGARGGRDVVVVSGGVSVGPHDHVKPALASSAWRSASGASASARASRPGSARRGDTLAFGLPGNPVSAMVTFQLFARPALAAAAGRRRPTRRARPRRSSEPDRAQPAARAGGPRPPLPGERPGWPRPPTGAQGSHVLTSMVGADGLALIAAGRGRGGGRRARGGRAPVRPRDPRRLLERHRRARARVTIDPRPRSRTARRTASTGSRQVAEVTLPQAELEKLWSPEHLERLARTYWSFLSRFSLGLIRVLYTRGLARGRVPAPPVRAAPLPQARVRLQPRRRHGHLADRPRRAGRAPRARRAATCG